MLKKTFSPCLCTQASVDLDAMQNTTNESTALAITLFSRNKKYRLKASMYANR